MKILKLFLDGIAVSDFAALADGLLDENKIPFLFGKAANEGSRSS
jgi:predicted GNAT family acetyltransferase